MTDADRTTSTRLASPGSTVSSTSQPHRLDVVTDLDGAESGVRDLPERAMMSRRRDNRPSQRK